MAADGGGGRGRRSIGRQILLSRVKNPLAPAEARRIFFLTPPEIIFPLTSPIARNSRRDTPKGRRKALPFPVVKQRGALRPVAITVKVPGASVIPARSPGTPQGTPAGRGASERHARSRSPILLSPVRSPHVGDDLSPPLRLQLIRAAGSPTRFSALCRCDVPCTGMLPSSLLALMRHPLSVIKRVIRFHRQLTRP